MGNWPLMAVAGTVVGLLLLVVLGVWGLPLLAKKRQGYPYEERVEPVLLPVLYQAICAAYKLSERAVDELGARMAGADKAAIARALYGELPDGLRGMVTQVEWAALVQSVFDGFLGFYEGVSGHLDEEFHTWVVSWGPESWGMED